MLPHVLTSDLERNDPDPSVEFLITPRGAYRLERLNGGRVQVDAPTGQEPSLHGLATTLLQAFPRSLKSVGGKRGRLILNPKPPPKK